MLAMTIEQRRTQRCIVKFPLRIVEAGGQVVAWAGETRDMGSGGVRFVMPSALPPGMRIDYVVTLSSRSPEAQIRCTGEVLRCVKSSETGTGNDYELAVSMKRYMFVPLELTGPCRYPVRPRTERPLAEPCV